MDLESAPRPEPKQAEAEILTDEEPQDSDVAIRSEIKPDNPAERIARLFFGADTLGPNEGKLQPWREGEAPVLMPMHPSVDPDIKRAAIAPAQKDAALRPDVKPEGETIAPKGEVTGEGKRPMTPAERLGLTGASRAKHERCLTNAIYFEARGENERGQMAVAQVVLNRAFSGYYPDNVCGVVYQNSHRHLACQFTFACDNVRDVVTEPDAWETAKRISRDSLDGKIWLPEIGKATHYHATYVSPWWVRTMTKHKTLGIHIFYRPTRWGDGSEAPAWGPAASLRARAQPRRGCKANLRICLCRDRAGPRAGCGKRCDVTHGVCENSQAELFSTIPQVATRRPFGVARQTAWPCSNVAALRAAGAIGQRRRAR